MSTRRRGPDLRIADKDLITGRDARQLVEELWQRVAPIISSSIDEAIVAERARVREERRRTWLGRLLVRLGA